MRPQHLRDGREFRSDKFMPRLVYGSDAVRAFVLCLEPGQGLAPRVDSEEMVCCVIEGRAKLTVGREVYSVSAGDVAAAPPGETRGIEAEDRCVVLWVHVSRGSGRHG